LSAIFLVTASALVSVSVAPAAAATGSTGLANLASAGSLQLLLDRYLGPAFVRASGDRYQNQSAGSQGLAQEIVAGELSPNVFLPIGSAAMRLLEPRFTRWAVRFAASPLVVAYYPRGPHAGRLKQISQGKLPLKDLFTLMARPGFKLGRTDPALDPQGQGFVEMVHLAERYLGVSPVTANADLGGASASSQIFSETGLDASLQAGQLDAASAYLPQAVQLGMPYISLPPKINFGDPRDSPIYARATLTLATGQVVHGSLLDLEVSELRVGGDPGAGNAFIRFLLGSRARGILTRRGYTLLSPTLLGRRAAAPGWIRALTQKR